MSEPLVDLEHVPGALEAILLMATEPVAAAELASAVGAPVEETQRQLEALAEFYDRTGRGFELRRVGEGWRYYTRREHADLIANWLLEGQPGKLSQAALETLAVVAYLQPISRGRVSSVRGVNVDGVMRTLATRDLIEEVGRDAETGAHLFGTTATFLEKMGLTSLDQLPPIAPYLPDASLLEAELSQLASPGEPLDAAGEPAPLAGAEPFGEAAVPDSQLAVDAAAPDAQAVDGGSDGDWATTIGLG
ncbi:MAG: SMC-Scp complex subunit ScpB [Propionibacteriaceae bacterium]|jgi:segregation and condensation protein B|nr:SMC-Scp complex subunit ScpB [Propionibacteriaceae bacterium]